MTIEDGYRIARAWFELKKAAGRRSIGRKIGLTSRAMQASAGITEPDYGTLLDEMAFEEGSYLPIERFINPQVEVELDFILSRQLVTPDVTPGVVLAAPEYVVPAVDIISRPSQPLPADTARP